MMHEARSAHGDDDNSKAARGMLASCLPAPLAPSPTRGWVATIVGSAWAERDTRNLLIYVVACVACFTLELVVGWMSHSIGLVSAAFHRMFHCVALCISLAAIILSRKSPSFEYSYGFDRHEVLAAFSNSVFLIFVAAFLITEALHRITDNPEVESTALLQMGVVGLLVSLTGVVLFRDHIAAFRIRYKSPWAVIDSLGRQSNLSSVLLHLFADTVSSVGIIAAGLLVRWRGWGFCDPLASIVIASLILHSCLPMVKSTAMVLLQTRPAGHGVRARIDRCLREASTFEGVLEVREEHFWTQSPGVFVATLNIRVHRHANEQTILANVHRTLAPLVTHLTIQVEKDPELDWLMPAGASGAVSGQQQEQQQRHGHDHAGHHPHDGQECSHGDGHGHSHGDGHGHSHGDGHGHSHGGSHGHGHGSNGQCDHDHSHGGHGHSHGDHGNGGHGHSHGLTPRLPRTDIAGSQ